ncbi:hypothetical protein SE19_00540 [Acidiplasma aeolicum]|uniref:Major facilitator superfamily (MFS) profile domain-containing protein n=1 Tax=Acidiplasma aeolicum TaxID=507754 RepID=A0A0N8PQM7_9ARCH|nr:MFS transporter [Acidiplasma aeolicum]KPV47557.1 hypothetical protein SE19_00540 [Acidiplasma aeolicum]
MDKIIDSEKFSKFLRLLYVATAIGAFTDIFDTSVVGGTSASIITSLNITKPEFGFLGSMTFIGGLFGALSFGYLSDAFGRKKTFIITLILFIVFEFLSGLAPDYIYLLVFRFVVGFAIGADYVPAITLLSEFVEPGKRGSSFDFFWILANLGALASYLVAFLLVPLGGLQWRILFIIGIIPPLLGLLIRSRIPETPRFFAIKGKIEDAKNSLKEIGLSEDNVNNYEKYNLSDEKLFKPYILGITIPLFLIMLLNIPPSGMLELTPLMLSTLKISKSDSLLFTSFAWVTPVVIGNIIAFKLMDLLGRIKMLIIGSLGLGIALIAMYVFSSYFFNVDLMLAAMASGGILQSFYIPVIYSLSTELYPTKIRGMGQGISIAGIRLAGIIGTFGGSLLLTYYKIAGILIGYAVICFLAIIVIVFWLGRKAETNKMVLEDIDKRFIKN